MTTTGSLAVRASGMCKNYGGRRPALDGFDLAVERGTVCALLGPNGAGKTTAVRILTTLLRPDAGQASVAGFDVAGEADDVRRAVSLVGQHAAVDDVLSGRRNLVLFARLHGMSRTAARARAEELLETFGLREAADRPVSGYSGGMRRRLDLAVSLVMSPQVLFVDEPTTGLDPQARRELWAAVRELVTTGVTVLLTTQYLEEAESLADRVAMLKDGRVVLEGTPAELTEIVGDTWLDLTLPSPAAASMAARLAEPFAATGGAGVNVSGSFVAVPVAERSSLLRLCAALAGAGVDTADIAVRRPSLDDVFVHVNSSESIIAEVHQ